MKEDQFLSEAYVVLAASGQWEMANSLIGNNDGHDSPIDESQIDWVTPQSPEELKELMRTFLPATP